MHVLTQCTFFNCIKGGNVSFDAKEEDEVKVIVAHCIKGRIEGDGPSFAIPSLGDNAAVTIVCKPDQGFIRLRGLEGQFAVHVADEDNQTRTINMEKDSVVKIVRTQSDVDPNLLIVSVLELDYNGELVTAASFSTEIEELALLDADPGAAPEVAPRDTEKDTDEEKENQGKKVAPFPTLPSTSSTSSSSTTTTTIMPDDVLNAVIPLPVTATRSRPTTTTTKPPVTPPGNT